MRQAEEGAEWAGLRLFHVTQVLPESKCREAPLRPRSAPRGVRHRRRRGSLVPTTAAHGRDGEDPKCTRPRLLLVYTNAAWSRARLGEVSSALQ